MTHYQKVVLVLFRLVSISLILYGFFWLFRAIKSIFLDSILINLFKPTVNRNSEAEFIKPPQVQNIQDSQFVTEVFTVLFDYPIIFILFGFLLFRMSLRLSETVCRGVDSNA